MHPQVSGDGGHVPLLTRALARGIAVLSLELALIESRRKRGAKNAVWNRLSKRGRESIIGRSCLLILEEDRLRAQDDADQSARLNQLHARIKQEVAAFAPRLTTRKELRVRVAVGRPPLLNRSDMQRIYGAKLYLWQTQVRRLGSNLVAAISALNQASKAHGMKPYALLDAEVSDLRTLRYLLAQGRWPGCSSPPAQGDTTALKRMAKCVQRLRHEEAFSLPGRHGAQVGSSR